MTFGENLKKIRLKKGLSQQELGKILGVTQQTVAQYEKIKSIPKLETAKRLAVALGVSIKELSSYSNFSINDIEEQDTKSDEIIELFETLNEAGQVKAIEQVQLIAMIPEYQAEIHK